MSTHTVPGYELIELIGKGGMSTVHRARDLDTGAMVAIKMVHPALTLDEEFVSRFHKETRLAGSIAHPNIARVIATGSHAKQHYIIMEHYEQGDLARKIRDKQTIDPFHVITSIARALEHAHARNIIHRDIKPANILFGRDGNVALADFGIAKTTTSTRLTTLGVTLGSPHYMSPEQARGKPLDTRTDLYSLGVVFYELLTGHPPFQAEDSFAIALMHINDAIPRLPPQWAHLQALLDSMLAKTPERRISSATELLNWLTKLDATPRKTTSEQNTRPARWQRLVWATSAIAAMAVVAWVMHPRWTNTSNQPLPQSIATATPSALHAPPRVFSSVLPNYLPTQQTYTPLSTQPRQAKVENIKQRQLVTPKKVARKRPTTPPKLSDATRPTTQTEQAAKPVAPLPLTQLQTQPTPAPRATIGTHTTAEIRPTPVASESKKPKPKQDAAPISLIGNF